MRGECALIVKGHLGSHELGFLPATAGIPPLKEGSPRALGCAILRSMHASTRLTLVLTLGAAALAASAHLLGCSPIERDFSTGGASGTGGSTGTGTETC